MYTTAQTTTLHPGRRLPGVILAHQLSQQRRGDTPAILRDPAASQQRPLGTQVQRLLRDTAERAPDRRDTAPAHREHHRRASRRTTQSIGQATVDNVGLRHRPGKGWSRPRLSPHRRMSGILNRQDGPTADHARKPRPPPARMLSTVRRVGTGPKPVPTRPLPNWSTPSCGGLEDPLVHRSALPCHDVHRQHRSSPGTRRHGGRLPGVGNRAALPNPPPAPRYPASDHRSRDDVYHRHRRSPHHPRIKPPAPGSQCRHGHGALARTLTATPGRHRDLATQEAHAPCFTANRRETSCERG